jgi:DNA transformation protein
MFGGWGISVDGLTVAIVTDLGSGDKLWLKASKETRSRFEEAGCARFAYDMRQSADNEKVVRSMNYYSAPEEAMDSAHAMAP